MRADRLLSILLLLQIERRITTAELARRLEVSDRTIHRDMDALSAAGVPVVAARGTGGGWFLLDEYRTDLTGLSEAESQTLFLTTPTRLIADLGLARAASGALIKLRAALPRQQQPGAEDVRQRIHIDAAGWRQTEGALPAMPVLQEALWGNQRLWIRYRRSDDSESERTLDPLGLVAKGNLWYLIAASEGEIRTYRVSRIVAATLLDHPVTRPAGFDLAGYWAQSSREFLSRLPQYRATVRVAPHVLRMIRKAGASLASKRLVRPMRKAGRPCKCFSRGKRARANSSSASAHRSRSSSQRRSVRMSCAKPKALWLVIR